MLNDDFTPMDFVVMLLQRFFHKSEEQAIEIMLDIHHKGQGICGIYTRDIAETKMTQVHQASEQHEHPLRCIYEQV